MFVRTFAAIALLLVQIVSSRNSTAQEEASTEQSFSQIVDAAEAIKVGPGFSSRSDLGLGGGKCGFWISFEAARHWNDFTESQKRQLQALFTPEPTQKDTVIGHFHIFYDTTGANQPALLDDKYERIPNSYRAYVDSVGRIFNEVWDYEIARLGYSAPRDKNDQAVILYDVYVQDFGTRLYGQTVFTNNDRIGVSIPPRYASHIEIDNDYQGFYSSGIAGLKVTAAHEFHHAIQLSSYGYWSTDQYFYEITSTWMEDVVFHGVNDYLQYLVAPYNPPQRGQFLTPDVAFTSMDGLLPYSRAIWGKFIAKRYSPDLMRATWENMRQESSLPAIDHALNAVNSSFRDAFLQWADWNAHTGPYSDTNAYYTEGRLFPTMRLKPQISYTNTPRTFLDTIGAVSSTYRPVCLRFSSSDSCTAHMLVTVSNLNIEQAYGSSRYPFTYKLSNTSDGTMKALANGIFVGLDVPDPSNWVSQEDVHSVISDVLVFPNPFSPRAQKPISFRLPSASIPMARLYVFDSNMEKIVSKDVDVVTFTSEPKIQWDGHDGGGNLVATGVYFYVIIVGDKRYIGKFAIVKE